MIPIKSDKYQWVCHSPTIETICNHCTWLYLRKFGIPLPRLMSWPLLRWGTGAAPGNSISSTLGNSSKIRWKFSNMFHNSPYCFHVSCSAKDFGGSSAPCVDCVQPIGRRTPVSTISTPTPCYSHWAVPWQDADGWSDLLSSTLTCQFLCSLLLCCFVRCISLHLMWQQLALQNWTKIDRCFSNAPWISQVIEPRSASTAQRQVHLATYAL